MANNGKIPGQGQPIDAATDLLWRNNENFAEVFSKIVFKGIPVDPAKLKDMDAVESAMLRVKDGATSTLKQTRDVVKALESSAWLVIMGVENQSYIDYLMPFRIYELNFINLARQVNEIRRKHVDERKRIREAKEKGESIALPQISEDELLSGFYKKDRLNPVITLVIYYGEEEWRKPLKLSDLFVDSPFTSFADDMPMYLLDVRHMDRDEVDSFSPNLRAFFGFLKYDKTSEFDSFIADNDEFFRDLPELEFDALVEITGSKELEKYKEEYRTSKGGINVCYGIEEGKKKLFVETAQRFKQTIEDTIKAFVDQFGGSEFDAETTVRKYWKPAQ